eukprot:TRINITY_DN7020_c0_g1_i1.p1 TRINITY_DN7020_c0_g1~~TRINITY_DN7020_c0_g1_i1.p1  ORF type:complete len:496 (-),score=164.86 TRINITY_DN7020_c0_g1_i1:389-1834(-)
MASSVASFAVRNPYTLETIASVRGTACSELGRVIEQAARATRAQAAPLASRLAATRRVAELIRNDTQRLGLLATHEMGKPIAQAVAEVRGLAESLDFWADNAASVLAPLHVDSQSRIEREPLGVVACVSAWNYPYSVPLNVLGPALVLGNAVVFKPSEHALLCGQALVDVLVEAGFDDQLLHCVVGDGELGAALVGDERIDGVAFTGSVAAGQKIVVASAKHVVPLQLELGGKDAAYVHCDVGTSDASVRAAARRVAVGALYNAGQSCSSVERLFVHTALYERFLDELRIVFAEFEAARGDPSDESTQLGPLTRGAEHCNALRDTVDAAVAQGARLVCGGRAHDERFFEPTLLADATSDMGVMRDECFGPLLAAAPVESAAAAFAAMDNSAFGLTASVFSHDRLLAESLLSRLDVGTALWNTCDATAPALPWTGRRLSGVGGTQGLQGLFCTDKTKSVVARRRIALILGGFLNLHTLATRK